MSVIDVVSVSAGGTVVLPDIGRAEFDGQGGVCFHLEGRQLVVALHDTGVVEGALVTIWSNASTLTVMIHQHQGSRQVASVSLSDGVVVTAPVSHDADLETGLWHSEFVESHFGPLLVYELGVIAFGSDGRVRWRTELPSIQWVYLGLESEELVFDNEFEGQWRFALDTGQRRARPM